MHAERLQLLADVIQFSGTYDQRHYAKVNGEDRSSTNYTPKAIEVPYCVVGHAAVLAAQKAREEGTPYPDRMEVKEVVKEWLNLSEGEWEALCPAFPGNFTDANPTERDDAVAMLRHAARTDTIRWSIRDEARKEEKEQQEQAKAASRVFQRFNALPKQKQETVAMLVELLANDEKVDADLSVGDCGD